MCQIELAKTNLYILRYFCVDTVNSTELFEAFKQKKKNAGHEMAIVGEPCNADAHANIPALFISMLCPCCVDTYTVQLYTLTVTVQLSH